MTTWAQNNKELASLNVICVQEQDRDLSLVLTPNTNLANAFLYTDIAFEGIVKALVASSGGGGGVLSSWHSLASLPTGLTWQQAPAVFDPATNKIFLWGGLDQGETRMVIYDLATQSWSYGTDSGIIISNQTATLVGGKIYYIGGLLWDVDWNSSDNVHAIIYDIASGSFSTGVSEINNPVYKAASVVYNDEIYVFGGTSSSGYQAPINFEETITNDWGVTQQRTTGNDADYGTYIITWNSSGNNDLTERIRGMDSLGRIGAGTVDSVTLSLDTACDIKIKLVQASSSYAPTTVTVAQEVSAHHNGNGVQTFNVNFSIADGDYNIYLVAIYLPNAVAASWASSYGTDPPSYVKVGEDISGTVSGLESRLFAPLVSIHISASTFAIHFTGNWLTKYTPSNDSFSSLSSEMFARNGHQAQIIADKVCIFGGIGDYGALPTQADICDLSLGTWSQASSDVQTQHGGSFVWQSKIYLWGGTVFDLDQTPAGNLYCYDPAIDTLTVVASVPDPTGGRRYFAYATDGNGLFYVIGGQSDASMGSGSSDFNTIGFSSAAVYSDVNRYNNTPSAYLGNLIANESATIGLRINFPPGFLGERIIPIYLGYGDNIVAP